MRDKGTIYTERDTHKNAIHSHLKQYVRVDTSAIVGTGVGSGVGLAVGSAVGSGVGSPTVGTVGDDEGTSVGVLTDADGANDGWPVV